MRLVDTSGDFTFRKVLMANRPSAHRPGLSAESISKQSKSVRTLPVHFICREMRFLAIWGHGGTWLVLRSLGSDSSWLHPELWFSLSLSVAAKWCKMPRRVGVWIKEKNMNTWKITIYSQFSHEEWWFSIVFPCFSLALWHALFNSGKVTEPLRSLSKA